MTLIDAPAYDPRRDNLKRNIGITVGVVLLLAVVLGLSGFVSGHGWWFTNLLAEHKVNTFYTALENKDYPKAYGIWVNDTGWQQQPQKYSGYPLSRFTDDWTKFSPVKTAITSHQIYVSKTVGKGAFGTGIIVAAQVNNSYKCTFIRLDRGDGTMALSTYEIGYDKCHNTE